MNERIRELVEQAGFTANDEQKVFLKVYEQECKKLAELIVRDVVEQIITRERTDGEWYQTDIFKHFGVE